MVLILVKYINTGSYVEQISYFQGLIFSSNASFRCVHTDSDLQWKRCQCESTFRKKPLCRQHRQIRHHRQIDRFSHRDLDVFEDLLIGSVDERRGTTAPGISNRTADLTHLAPAADIRTTDRSSRPTINNERE